MSEWCVPTYSPRPSGKDDLHSRHNEGDDSREIVGLTKGVFYTLQSGLVLFRLNSMLHEALVDSDRYVTERPSPRPDSLHLRRRIRILLRKVTEY